MILDTRTYLAPGASNKDVGDLLHAKIDSLLWDAKVNGWKIIPRTVRLTSGHDARYGLDYLKLEADCE